MWISSKWRGGQSQAAGQRRSSFQRPSLVYLAKGRSVRERARYGVCRGARPAACTLAPLEGRLAALPARRSPRGRCSAARKPFPAVLSLAVPGSPLLFVFFFNFFETAIEIKRPLGAIETAGRLCSCSPWSTSSGWGRAAGAELEKGCAPSRRRGPAAGRPRAEYLCYILKNLNK